MTNPKSQTNLNYQNSKSQTRISREWAVLVIENWDFEFVYYLVLMIWNLFACPARQTSLGLVGSMRPYQGYLVLACPMPSGHHPTTVIETDRLKIVNCPIVMLFYYVLTIELMMINIQ